ncbi:hypothetical protein GCM10023185_29490 [Hymenobacter saemangeumensis]|uniref:T9SS type A sorting domain-containing protein n=1 Tax=Hymenobacter saemangeumensis TaxID=1084522 RepID=A0ABP8IL13_9BACT
MRIFTKRWKQLWFGQTPFLSPRLRKRASLAGLAVLLSSLGAQAQLSGIKTIDPAGSGPNNYTTFTAAVNALNAGGNVTAAGGVTFNVAKVAFTEATGVPAITVSGSATAPIIFQENGLTPSNLADNPTITRTTGNSTLTDAVVAISGGDYITFDGINVDVTAGLGANAVEFGYLVRNTASSGAIFNTIRNARIVLDRANVSSVGVLQSSSAATTAGASGGGGVSVATGGTNFNTNNTYSGLVIENAYKGIHLLTASTTVYDANTTISGCTIGASMASVPGGDIGNATGTSLGTVTAGIQAVRQTEVNIFDNTVQNVVSFGAIGSGISVEGAYGPSNVYRNRVLHIRNVGSSSTSTVYGMRLDIAPISNAANVLTVHNNFVAGISHAYTTATSSRYLVGIATQVTTSTATANGSIHLFYNSVRIEALPSYAGSSIAFNAGAAATTGPVLTVRNNIFANFSPVQASVTPSRIAIGSTTTATFGGTGSTSDYNDLYVLPGQGAAIGSAGTTIRVTLADWQTSYPNTGQGGAVPIDNSSLTVDPEFGSDTDLHTSLAALNNAGTPVTSSAPGIGVDIDLQARSASTPDIGADEFTPAASDVAVLSLASPTAPVATGPRTVSVLIRNNGTSTLNTVRLEYTLNGGSAVGQNFTIAGGLAPNATTTLTFTTQATLTSGANTFVVTGSLPNGGADPTAANNSITATVYTALSGTYTINRLAGASATNFVSFTAAAAALNNGGISASVRFNVLNGPYTEQFALAEVAGVSPTDTIVVDGGASKQTLSYSGTVSQPAAVQLNGTDYVTLNNLTIDVSAGATYGIGVHLVGAANFNRVSNSVIRAPSAATSATANYGVAVSGSVTSGTTAGSATDLRVQSNTISGGYNAVIATGALATMLTGIYVTNNVITDTYLYGIDLEFTDGATVTGNDISRPTRATFSTFAGLYFTGATLNAYVTRNRIHDPATATPTSTSAAYGIYFTSADGTPGNGNVVFNNLVYNFITAGIQYGIYNVGSDYGQYYHNTISLDHAASTSTSVTYGFYQTTQADGIEFRNNIVSVTRGGTANRVALYFNTPASNISSNYNDLYVGTGGNYFTGYYGATYATLLDWQGANGRIYDQNSVQADPNFVGATLVPSSAVLNGAGDPALLPIVPRDFANVLRSNPPDLGAYEFTPVANDVAVLGFVAPAPPIAAGSSPVTVTLQNNGGGTLNSVTLAYTYNGGTTVTQTFTGLNIVSGQTGTATFTTPVVLQPGSATLSVVASLPNNTADGDPSNNTFTTTFNTALSGTYTINNLAGASATNFVSFTAAATALNAGGILGPVQFNVLNGPYTEQIELGQIAGTSATDTVVFNGNSRTIRFGSADANQRAVIKLNGTDYVSFLNLTIDATNGGATPAPTYGWGVHLINGADYNRFRGCDIRTDMASTSSVNYAGIVGSGSNTSPATLGNSASFLRLENNTVSGGYYGIILNGASTTVRSQGLLLTGNEVRDFYLYGIDVENSDGARIVSNNVHRPTRGNGSTFYGVYMSGSINAAVERNRIHHPFTGNPTSTSSAYGVYFSANDGLAGSENDVVNNLIYDFNGSGIAYGIYNSSSDFARYYHNTISLDNTGVTSTSATAGFYQTTLATGIEFVNNVVSVTRNPSGTGAKNALLFSTATSSIYSDYNDLFVGTGTNFYTGTHGTTTFATLANWRTANNNSYDANSVQADPLFAAPASGNFVPMAVALNNVGLPSVLARVPRDFANVLRNSPPDLGAFEFTPVAIDLAPVALVAPLSNPSCPGTAESVEVSVRNMGSSTLNFAANPATVTVSVTGATTATLTATVNSGTLASGATRSVTLSPTLNMSAVGTYTFAISAAVAGDQNSSNTLLTPSPTATVAAPVAGTITPSSAVLCVSGTVTLNLAGAANGSTQFQQSTDNMNFVDVSTGTGGTTTSYTTGTLTQTTYFRAQTRCNSSVANSNVVTVTVNNPQPAATNAPQAICSGSTATLTVTGTTGQTFQFFGSASGGTALTSTTGGTASSPTASFTTPALTANTTYYVETSTGGVATVGPLTNTAVSTSGGGFSPTVKYGMIFNATNATTLTGVYVYPTAAGNAVITLESAVTGGTVLQTYTATLTAADVNQKTFVPLNFNVPAGNGLLLSLATTTNGTTAVLYRNTAGGNYPYVSSDGNVTITSNNFASQATTYYYYFYDWRLGSTCTGSRVPLQVNVTPATTLSGTQSSVSGTYCDVNITGNATLTGPLTVNGTLTLASGASLNTNCQTISGTGSFVMQAGSTLLICSPAGITASGANGPVQVSGTRSYSPDASYVYNGSAAQVTGNGLPAQVRNLTVDNAAGLSLSQALSVAQVIRLSNGNLSTSGNGLTLLSSAAGTALVVNTSGVVSGTVTVQRYIDPSLNPGLGYRHYAPPVLGSTVADLATATGFTPVVNPAYNTSANPGFVTPFPTVYGYDETRLVSSPATSLAPFEKGWFSPASLASPLQNGRGYTVNIGANQLVDFNGTLVNGDQTFGSLSRGTDAEAGWQFLGNPFPSPIDWSMLSTADFTNLDQAVYIYKSTGRYTGAYTAYVNGVGGPQEIATAQGFFVRTSSPGTGTLRLPNAIRKTTYSAQPTFNRTAGTRPLLQLELSGASLADAAYVYFEQGATAAADGRHDAVKMPNTHGLNLSSVAAGASLAINGLPLLGSQATVVPLQVAAPQAGSYTFAVAELLNFLPGTQVELRDALTGRSTLLQAGTRYTATLPAGSAGTRFSLVFREAAVTASQSALDAALVSLYPNPAHGRFTLQVPPVSGHAKVHTTLLNALGQVVAERSLPLTAAGATTEFNTSSLAAGVYTLQVRAGQLLVTKRVVVE